MKQILFMVLATASVFSVGAQEIKVDRVTVYQQQTTPTTHGPSLTHHVCNDVSKEDVAKVMERLKAANPPVIVPVTTSAFHPFWTIGRIFLHTTN